MAEEKSKILIVGPTGYLGKYITEASVNSGHPTFALLRKTTVSDPARSKLIARFQNSGVTILTGDLNDHRTLVNAIKQADVVISAVGFKQIADQHKLIAAIKEAGNVQRFFPSTEFASDFDRTHVLDPVNSNLQLKAQLRRAIEAAGIPYTYVVFNLWSGYALSNLLQCGATAPPRDRVVVPGDGNVRAVFNCEEDIAAYTIRAVGDPRTLNKILYINPPKNVYSFNELVALWEKIGRALEKEYVPEEEILKQIHESPVAVNIELCLNHAIFVRGDQDYAEIDSGVEASQLYPDVKYTTVEEYLQKLV